MTIALLALAVGHRGPIPARPASEFLDSLGVNSAISRRGERLEKTIECANYLGVRWFRSGYEGDPALEDLIELHRRTGVRLSWGLLSGGADLAKLLGQGRRLAKADALLAFEGPNEPNNWGVTYEGQPGGKDGSWKPVAALQRDLWRAVHADPLLRKYPVWSLSEGGAETENVGLQFLAVPKGVGTQVPEGTRYADFANVHNYVYHPSSPTVENDKTWNAADPSAACKVDGLYGEYGQTWRGHYAGYGPQELLTLPRVTTETGCAIEGEVTERVHALNLLSLYLDQFKRGWSHTAVYLLRDRTDEAGNQRFGFYGPDYAPRLAALYLHNLTTILADRGEAKKPGTLGYAIPDAPATVHNLLLRKGDGTFELVVWSELVKSSNEVFVRLGKAFPRVRLYDPTVGPTVVRTFERADAVPLTLTDHPLIVEIPGGNGTRR